MKYTGVIPTLRSKYETLQPFLNERVRRLWSATEAMGLGHGGIAALAEATGMSRTTISHAIQEIQDQRESPGSTLPIQRSRRPGAGRKRLITQDPALLITLELLVDPTTRGEPMSPLRWTCKSTRKLAEQLRQYGYQIRARTVAHLLHQLNYSLQVSMDPNRYAVSEPELLRSLRLSGQGGFLQDHPGIAVLSGSTGVSPQILLAPPRSGRGTRASVPIVTRS